jgi:DNA-binding LacI/PurR family transcriptional regulator
MAFRVLFLAHAPDADKDKHRTIIDTGMYRLITAVVKDQPEAVEVCCEIVQKESIDAVLLCPGFTHSDVAEIARAAGPTVSVSVARGDGPSGKVSLAARKRAGYLPSRPVE